LNPQRRMFSRCPSDFIQPSITCLAERWPWAMFSPPGLGYPSARIRSAKDRPSLEVCEKYRCEAMSVLCFCAALVNRASTEREPHCGTNCLRTSLTICTTSAAMPVFGEAVCCGGGGAGCSGRVGDDGGGAAGLLGCCEVELAEGGAEELLAAVLDEVVGGVEPGTEADPGTAARAVAESPDGAEPVCLALLAPL
jgi:hypothetical protein